MSMVIDTLALISLNHFHLLNETMRFMTENSWELSGPSVNGDIMSKDLLMKLLYILTIKI